MKEYNFRYSLYENIIIFAIFDIKLLKDTFYISKITDPKIKIKNILFLESIIIKKTKTLSFLRNV
mgnify:CR=1 FL=1